MHDPSFGRQPSDHLSTNLSSRRDKKKLDFVVSGIFLEKTRAKGIAVQRFV